MLEGCFTPVRTSPNHSAIHMSLCAWKIRGPSLYGWKWRVPQHRGYSCDSQHLVSECTGWHSTFQSETYLPLALCFTTKVWTLNPSTSIQRLVWLRKEIRNSYTSTSKYRFLLPRQNLLWTLFRKRPVFDCYHIYLASIPRFQIAGRWRLRPQALSLSFFTCEINPRFKGAENLISSIIINWCTSLNNPYDCSNVFLMSSGYFKLCESACSITCQQRIASHLTMWNTDLTDLASLKIRYPARPIEI